MKSFLRGVYSAVTKKKKTLPAAVRPDKDKGVKVGGEKVVFLSVGDLKSRAYIAQGRGETYYEATSSAVKNYSSYAPEGHRPAAIKLDVITQYRPISRSGSTIDVEEESIRYRKTFEGLALGKCADFAFLPEEVQARNLVEDGKIRTDNMARAQNKHLPQGDIKLIRSLIKQVRRLRVYKFCTEGYYVDEKEHYPLFRGHRLYYHMKEQELCEEILKNIGWSKDYYYKNVVRKNGRFVYSWLADKAEKERRYNILRHAGTTYAMWEVYELTPDKELYSSAKAATDYLINQIKDITINGKNAKVLVEKDAYKLGGSGLSLIALAKYTETTKDRQHVPLMQGLALWLEQFQQEDGSFPYHKIQYSTDEPYDFTCGYYLGEAILGLMRLYQIDGDTRWLDVAEKAMDCIIRERTQTGEISIRHDHWLLYSLNELYRERPKQGYIEHALAIAESMMEAQVGDDEAEEVDLAGGIQGSWRGKNTNKASSAHMTAFHGEGLCAAYKLIRDFHSQKKAQEIKKTMEGAIKFLLQYYLRPESAMYYRKQKLCLGGVRGRFNRHDIMIDCVQHSTSFLLQYYHSMAEVNKHTHAGSC